MPELHLANRVKELTTTEGTGAVSLEGALDGHQSFADSPITDGQTVAYVIRHRTIASEWEVGYGTFDATAGTLSRDTVLESPTDALIDFSSGDKIVFVGHAAEEILLEGTAESISAVWDFAGGLNVGGVQLADGSGEIPDARLSSNVALLDAAQTFSAAKTFNSKVTVGAVDFLVDTDTLFVDASADRVGIGTSSPGVPLEVSASESRFRMRSSAAGGQVWDFTSGGGSALAAGWFAFQRGGSVNVMQFSDDAAADVLRVDGSFLGVGETTPAATLHVGGDTIIGTDPGGSELLRVGGNTRISGQFSVTGTLVGSDRLRFGTSDQIDLFWDEASELFKFQDRGTADRFTFDMLNGRLGIGTASPGRALDVAGSVKVRGSELELGTSGLPNFGKLRLENADVVTWRNAADGGDIQTLQVTSADVVQLGDGFNDIHLSAPSVIIGTDPGGSELLRVGGGARFSDTVLMETDKRIQFRDSATFIREGGGLVVESGGSRTLNLNPSGSNVGIGTASPGALLDVDGGIVRVTPVSNQTGVQIDGDSGSNIGPALILDDVATASAGRVRLAGGSNELLIFEVLNAGMSLLLTGDGGTVVEVTDSAGVSELGFFGVTPVAQPGSYTPTNVVTDRSYDANATTTAELADVLGTLIADLQSLGLVS